MFDLRYYQQELVGNARAAWEEYQSAAIIAATGSGKSEMYMSLAVEEVGRVMVLVHRDYLIRQPISRLAAVGYTDVGVEKAENYSEAGICPAKIVFASVSTIGPKKQEHRLKKFNPMEFSLVIVDEAHRGVSESYRRVLDYFRRNPRLKVLLVTATPNRKDGVALGNICDTVAGVYGPSSAMDEGWIVPVQFYRRDVKSLDFSTVRLKGTDLDAEHVQQLLLEEEPLHEVCASLAKDEGSTLVFCPQVAVARAYCELMNSRYRPNSSRVLWDESSDEERDEASKMLVNNEINYIFNVGLFTEGLDLPNLQRVVWAAPTASLVRYAQGTGRVFRTHDSLRRLLRGGPEESAQRRALIANSPKPFGIVVTYYPQNCRHELCDPIDILGGTSLSADVKAFARQVQEQTARQGGGSKTEEDIETAKVFCDLRGILEERRKEIRAETQYVDRRFDPMSGRKLVGGTKDAGRVRDAGKVAASAQWPEGEEPTEKQMKWLYWKQVVVPDGVRLTKFRASVLIDLIQLGVSPDTAMSYGMRQAMSVRNEMRSRKEKEVAS